MLAEGRFIENLNDVAVRIGEIQRAATVAMSAWRLEQSDFALSKCCCSTIDGVRGLAMTRTS